MIAMVEKLPRWLPEVKHSDELDQAAAKREAELLEMKRWDHCHHVAEVPVRILRLLTSDKMDWTHAPVRAVRHLAAADRRVIVLMGAPGTGKSIAACTALWDAADGRYIRADAYAQLARSFDQLDRKITDQLVTARILVVDDVGEEPGKEHNHIERLLSQRYDGDGMTIITTNYKPVQMLKAYGHRIASRIDEVGEVVECKNVIRPGKPRQGRLL